VDRHFHAATNGYAALQPQIMGDSKSPATKIAARFLVNEMLEEGEKHFLHDFFSILKAQSGSE
jgi:hypothetical protein